jgi:hypothetical protein
MVFWKRNWTLANGSSLALRAARLTSTHHPNPVPACPNAADLLDLPEHEWPSPNSPTAALTSGH